MVDKLSVLIALVVVISVSSTKCGDQHCQTQDEISLVQSKLEVKKPIKEEIQEEVAEGKKELHAYAEGLHDGLQIGETHDSQAHEEGKGDEITESTNLDEAGLGDIDICKDTYGCGRCVTKKGEHMRVVQNVRFCAACATGFYSEHLPFSQTSYKVSAVMCHMCDDGMSCGPKATCKTCHGSYRCMKTSSFNIVPLNKNKYPVCVSRSSEEARADVEREYLEAERFMAGKWKMKLPAKLGGGESEFTITFHSPTRLTYEEFFKGKSVRGRIYRDEKNYGVTPWWYAEAAVEDEEPIAFLKLRPVLRSKSGKKLSVKLLDVDQRTGETRWSAEDTATSIKDSE